MKKILFLFAMLMTVAGAQAKVDKLYAKFASVSGNGNISWDASTNTINAWGANSNTYQMFSFTAGTLSKYEKFYFPIDETNYAHVRILFLASGTTKFTARFGSGGNKSVTLEGWNSYGATLDAATIAIIDEIRIGGYDVSSYTSESPCAISIDPAKVYLESAAYEGMNITTPIAELYWYQYSDDTEYDRSASALQKQLNKDVAGNNQILYGPYSGNATTAYMDVTGYDNALIALNTAGTPGIRLMYNSETITIDTDNTNTSYTQSVTSMPKIATIKTKNGSGEVSFNIKSIDFTKSFNAEGATAFNIAKSSSSTVAYDRTFTAGQKSTVCLPFALTEDEAAKAGKFYELTDCDGSSLTFKEVTETEAYKPYLFVPAGATPFASLTDKEIPATAATYATTAGSATFQGTLKKETVASGVYGYSATEGKFVKVTGTEVTINAFRAYITVSGGAGAQSLDIDLGGTTGISTVKTQVKDNDNTIYNLNGQRVGTDYKGIVIKNGKKVIVK